MIDANRWRGRLAAEIVARSGLSRLELLRQLGSVVDEAALSAFDRWLDRSTDGAASSGGVDNPLAGLDELLPGAERAAHGIYFTPPEIADRIAARLSPAIDGRVVDLACGDGALLVALAERCPEATLVGVERDPLLAVAAAVNLLRRQGGPRSGDYIHCGDGLAPRHELRGAAAVVGNPPYVGEKGNRALFKAVREANPHLEGWFGARIDLHYLFLHQAVELLAPDGFLVQLTSEYWLTATGARLLRRHLAASTRVVELERLGLGAFASAPGHHSLLLVARRSPTDAAGLDLPRDGSSWHPFAEAPRLKGVPLGEVCRDRQGFVSGADRLSSRHARTLGRAQGEPVFLWRADEIPAGDDGLFRPVLRRSECIANRVFRQTPGEERVLWVDDALPETDRPRVEALLEVYRPLLEARREVQRGLFPWSRIWWPRSAEEYAQPKLVVPRRATSAQFCLDLSGAHVSSDCTFILCDPQYEPIPSLLAVMLVANDPRSFEHLRQYGKSKGDIVEFYSEPLRQLPLEIELVDGVLVPRDATLRDRWERGIAAIERGGAHIDV